MASASCFLSDTTNIYRLYRAGYCITAMTTYHAQAIEGAQGNTHPYRKGQSQGLFELCMHITI